MLGLNHTFDAPGTYELALGGDERTVEVREPAEGRVTDVTATSRDVLKGEFVRVSARVQNDAPIPAETSVVFRRDDGLARRGDGPSGPGSARWVNASVPMSRTGATTVPRRRRGGGDGRRPRTAGPDDGRRERDGRDAGPIGRGGDRHGDPLGDGDLDRHARLDRLRIRHRDARRHAGGGARRDPGDAPRASLSGRSVRRLSVPVVDRVE